MRNTLQNMLLEEMENFHGILLATTNMTQNLDPAFERRFLYKVRFQAPDQSMRSRLHRSLSAHQCCSKAKAVVNSRNYIEARTPRSLSVRIANCRSDTGIHWLRWSLRLLSALLRALSDLFSPGEMQNIATKLHLRRMLNPKAKVFETVLGLCREEKWGHSERTRLGIKLMG
jgi:hypothetical protein